ncbi:Secretion system C-terminal sorting domain [Flavobacteriaceae bacterium]
MKKLFLFIFLMTISLGQSQTFPLDFSDAADLLPGVDGVTTSIVQDNGGPVMQIVGATGSWDNCQIILAQDVNLSDNNNNTITFRFKSIGASTSGQHLIKFEGGSGGAAFVEGFFNATGTEWQTITINFGAGLGKYSKLVIFTDSGAASNGYNNAATGTYLIDDIAGGTNVVPPVVLAPSVAASVPTARNAWDVISLYTDGTYADRAGTNFNPGWGQATVQSTLTLNGNNMLKYSNLNYQGIQLAGNTNISSMTTLHVDIYSPDATALDFRIISGGEFNKTLTLTSGQWNSFDIPLSDYVGANLAILNQLKFQTNPFGALRNTVYLDNIYFYRPATDAAPPTFGEFTVPVKLVGDAAFDLTAPTSTGSGAFTFTSSNTAVATISGSTVTIVGAGSSTITATQAASGGFATGSVSATLTVTVPNAPTPTNDAADVISVFSSAYTDVANTAFFPYWGQSTQYAQENGMLKYSNLNYQGITFASPINGSAMEKLHIDIWTPNCTSFQMFVLDGSAPEQSVNLTPSFNGWNSYDIDLAQYTSLTKSNLVEFKMVGSGTVYLDNIYFWKLPAGLNTYYADADGDGYGAGAAVLSTATTAPAGFSVNNTDCDDTVATSNPGASEVLNGVDDDCNGVIDNGVLPTIPATDAPTAPDRNSWDVQSVYSSAYTNFSNVNFFPNWGQSTTFSTYTPVNDETLKYSNLTFQGIDFNGAKNISAMTKLHIDVWTPDMSSFQVWLIAGGENAVTLTPTLSGWNSYDIDLATQYPGRNLSAAIQLKLERTLWTPTDGNVNSLYVDNIYFYRPATTQPPTLGAFTVPAKVAGDAAFDLTAPTSTSTGAFTYTSSNAGVATISGSTVTIVGAGTSTITATQAADGGYAAISVTAILEVSLASAAPTPPAIPTDRVLSLFSDAFSNVSGTQWRPNWGQATQYNLVNVVGNPTIKYSNLNYEGVQLASPVDVSSYTTLHIDVYGAGTSAVDFYVINQAGGAGSPLQQIEVNTPLTLLPGVWNSFDIELSSLTGLELNRVGQFKFVGSGTIYLDNIYFTKPIPSHTTAPTVADVTYCKGATASTLTATAIGTNLLKWYSTATIATALTVAPKPVTTLSGTKKYYVAQVMSDGFVSPRAEITVTVTTDAVPLAPSALTTSDAVICKHFGTITTVTYTATSADAVSYVWTVPTGVNIIGSQTGSSITVNFANVALNSLTSLGSIGVKAVNAAGCTSNLAKSLVLTPALPAAPSTLVLTNGVTTTAITTIGGYLGTSTELTLTAAVAPTGTSYEWSLPPGVVLMSGSNERIITVNFSGVTGENTVLPIVVKTVAGCGKSIAKTLNLIRAIPTAPTTLVLTKPAPATQTAVTSIGQFLGTDTPFTLTAGAVATATSYEWELPTGVVRTDAQGTNSTGRTITVNFSGVEPGTSSLYLGVKGKNLVGVSITNNSAATVLPITSSTAKLLKLTAIAPVAPATLVLSTTTSATAITSIGAYQGTTIELKLTAGVVATATSYEWELPEGVVRKDAQGTNSTSNSIIVDLSGTTLTPTTSLYIGVKSKNGFGVSVTATNGTLTPISTSTAKLLKLTAALPATPGVITPSTTNVCSVVGTSTNVTYTVAPVVGAFANGYTWTVPDGASIVGSATGNSITVSYSSNFTVAGIVTVKSSNGVGPCATAKTLAITRVATVTPVSIGGGTTYSNCDQTFTTPAVIGAAIYNWTVPTGATIVSGQGTNSVVVNYGSLRTAQTLKVSITNGCGLTSALKSIALTYLSCTPPVVNTTSEEMSKVSITEMYPNPTTDSFNVTLSATKSGSVSVTVYSFDGMIVSSKNVQLSEGNNVLNENLSSQRNGIYIVKVINEVTGEVTIKKIIKQ